MGRWGWHRGCVALALLQQEIGEEPQSGPTHARMRPTPLHPGTRRSRHFAGRSFVLAAAILRRCPAREYPGPRGMPSDRGSARSPLPLAAGGADYTPGPPRHRPRPGACRRRPASSGRPQAARRPGPVEPVPPGPSPLSRAGPWRRREDGTAQRPESPNARSDWGGALRPPYVLLR